MYYICHDCSPRPPATAFAEWGTTGREIRKWLLCLSLRSSATITIQVCQPRNVPNSYYVPRKPQMWWCQASLCRLPQSRSKHRAVATVALHTNFKVSIMSKEMISEERNLRFMRLVIPRSPICSGRILRVLLYCSI